MYFFRFTKKKIFIFLLVFLLLAVFYLLYGPALGKRKTIEYHIKYNQPGSFKKNIYKMAADDIISSATCMYILARLSGEAKKVKAGYYTLNSKMNMLQILDILTSGRVDTYPVVIKAGYDIYNISKALAAKKIAAYKDALYFFKASATRQHIADHYNIKKPLTAEGFIFPETYALQKEENLSRLLEMSFNLFDSAIYGYYKKNSNTKNFYFYLKIASLIEREAALPEERPLISSVIYNRMRRNMKLKFCSTIIYALKKDGLYNDNLKDGVINIKRKHFYYKSRYNTYYYRSLPPTPICAVSPDSFRAALAPADTSYLFFVAKNDGSKGHHFSSSDTEHVRSVRKYQLGK